MAVSERISDMQPSSTLVGDELIPIVKDADNYTTTPEDLKNYMNFTVEDASGTQKGIVNLVEDQHLGAGRKGLDSITIGAEFETPAGYIMPHPNDPTSLMVASNVVTDGAFFAGAYNPGSLASSYLSESGLGLGHDPDSPNFSGSQLFSISSTGGGKIARWQMTDTGGSSYLSASMANGGTGYGYTQSCFAIDGMECFAIGTQYGITATIPPGSTLQVVGGIIIGYS